MFDLYKLPFDQYQRYKLVQDIAEALRCEITSKGQTWCQLTILDVGGYFQSMSGHRFLPMHAFLPKDQVVGLDVVESSQIEGYVQGSGMDLPFAEQTFDLVISCDTLEHLPPSSREKFLASLLRVS
jgi:hypothetical protein